MKVEDQHLQRRKRPARSCSVRTQAESVEEEHGSMASIVADDLNCLRAQRSKLRSMWQLASVLNFLHVFRPVLEIKVRFSAEDLETALITPNATLDDIHIPLLEAILPPRKIALGCDMWVTMLCKTLKDWWPWVADGELPIIASHGEEIVAYKELVPEIRLLILKALCEIRVEQDDIRSYIDDTLKNGGQLSTFYKERIGGNAYETSYWYDDDSTIGHRLYKEIHVKTNPKGKGSSSQVVCQWETIATNLDEFRAVLENLSLSCRVDGMLGNILKNEILPVLEKRQKQKEQALKRQQRHSMLLNSFTSCQGNSIRRYLRDRKPINYAYDDFDQSIEEAIQMSKERHSSPEPVFSRDTSSPLNFVSNAEENGHDVSPQMLRDGEGESDERWTSGLLEHGNQQRKRPQRYSKTDYKRAVTGNEANFRSMEAVSGDTGIDGKYIKCENIKKTFNSSDGNGEYKADAEDIGEDLSAGVRPDDDDGQAKQFGTRRSARRKRKQHRCSICTNSFCFFSTPRAAYLAMKSPFFEKPVGPTTQ